MKIRVGFEMIYDFPQPTPMIMVLGTHFTRASDIIVPDHLTTSPSVPITPYRDGFGNWCSRIVAPAGRMRLAADGIGPRQRFDPDRLRAMPFFLQLAVEELPPTTCSCTHCLRKPILRDRPNCRRPRGRCSRHIPPGVGAGPGDRRLHAQTTWNSAIILRVPTKTA